MPYVLSFLRRARVGSHVDCGAASCERRAGNAGGTRRSEGGQRKSIYCTKRTVATRVQGLQVELLGGEEAGGDGGAGNTCSMRMVPELG